MAAADGDDWDRIPNYLATPDRVMKDVPTPEWRRLPTERLFKDDGGEGVQVDVLRDHLAREGRLTEDAALRLLAEVRDLLHDEPNVLRLQAPLAVVGDLHGQFYDLLEILDGESERGGYLFLGDYVDRGCFGTEICFLLFAMKLRTPGRMALLRGNHECRLLTNHFNFKRECLAKYSLDVYIAFMDVFDQLPIAATVTSAQGTFLCIHGGLSPSISHVDELFSIFRFTEPPNDGPLCDILWSDPLEEESAYGLDPSDMEEWYGLRFADNPTRGCGFIFGWAAANEFCEANNLAAIIRGHEVQRSGCHMHRFLHSEEQRKLPLVITVFSAPNYCDIYRNVGAVMVLESETFEFKLYDYVSHPQWMPRFENAFDISLPLITVKIVEWMRSALSSVRREAKHRVGRQHSRARLTTTASSAATAAAPLLPAPPVAVSPPESPSPPSSPSPEESPPGSPPGEMMQDQAVAAAAAAAAAAMSAPIPERAMIRRRESLAKIKPGTVTSRISEFGQMAQANLFGGPLDASGRMIAPQELQVLLQGIFAKSRDSLLSRREGEPGSKGEFDAARWVDHENERRPPISELKRFWEEWKPTRYSFRYTDLSPRTVGETGHVRMRSFEARPTQSGSTTSTTPPMRTSGERSSPIPVPNGTAPSPTSTGSSPTTSAQHTPPVRQGSPRVPRK